MRPENDASLTGGGDCFSHWHSSDRQATQDLLHGLQGTCKTKSVSATYQINPDDDVIMVSGATTVTLPRAKNGQEYTVVRTGVSTVTINTASPDTVMGLSTLNLTTQWAARTFKAISGGWVIINGYL